MLRGGRRPGPAASLLPARPSVLRAISRGRLRRLRRWWVRRLRRRIRRWGPLVEKPAPPKRDGPGETGRDLITIKERLGHGHFLAWIDAEFGMTGQVI